MDKFYERSVPQKHVNSVPKFTPTRGGFDSQRYKIF
jgi:hypothetical protein